MQLTVEITNFNTPVWFVWLWILAVSVLSHLEQLWIRSKALHMTDKYFATELLP